MRFKETEVKLDFSTFGKMSRTEEASFRNNAPMLNLKGLAKREDSISKKLDSTTRVTRINTEAYYKTSSFVKGFTKVKSPIKLIKGSILKVIPKKDLTQTLQNAADITSSVKQVVNSSILEYNDKNKEIIVAFQVLGIHFVDKLESPLLAVTLTTVRKTRNGDASASISDVDTLRVCVQR
ncbi:MAG: hypothetical protein EOO61_09145 [Hymenobacter sp.]|nr:MAG: hypothetical protein EOO61_09145 [Hymenobacter sp.]